MTWQATLRETVRKARTPHRCDHCLRTIEPGEHYLNVAAIHDGAFATFTGCRACLDERTLPTVADAVAA